MNGSSVKRSLGYITRVQLLRGMVWQSKRPYRSSAQQNGKWKVEIGWPLRASVLFFSPADDKTRNRGIPGVIYSRFYGHCDEQLY